MTTQLESAVQIAIQETITTANSGLRLEDVARQLIRSLEGHGMRLTVTESPDSVGGSVMDGRIDNITHGVALSIRMTLKEFEETGTLSKKSISRLAQACTALRSLCPECTREDQ